MVFNFLLPEKAGDSPTPVPFSLLNFFMKPRTLIFSFFTKFAIYLKYSDKASAFSFAYRCTLCVNCYGKIDLG